MSLHQLISTYPAPESLREALLDHLHTLLQQVLPTDPVALRLTSTRQLSRRVTGSGLVDGLKTANETLSKAVEASAKQDSKTANAMADAYTGFLDEWLNKVADNVLVRGFRRPSENEALTCLVPPENIPPNLTARPYSTSTQERSFTGTVAVRASILPHDVSRNRSRATVRHIRS